MTVAPGTAAHPSAPMVAKLRLRYAKLGRARFASHRDVARALEWGLRRAGVPVALSQGFSPHPRLSWVNAVPTGAASEAEYLEIGLTEALDPEAVVAALDGVLPEGLAVLEGVRVPVEAPGSLPDRIEASRWRLEFGGVDEVDLAAAVTALWTRDTVTVERMTKKGPRTLDVRAALVDLRVDPGPPDPAPARTVTAPPDRVTGPGGSPRHHAARSAVCGTLSAVVRHTTPTVRPDDVSSALRTVAGLVPPVPLRATRTAQGRLDGGGGLLDPLAEDRT